MSDPGFALASAMMSLRFFAGLTVEETGEVLQVSAKTVERDWQTARALLFKMLSEDHDS